MNEELLHKLLLNKVIIDYNWDNIKYIVNYSDDHTNKLKNLCIDLNNHIDTTDNSIKNIFKVKFIILYKTLNKIRKLLKNIYEQYNFNIQINNIMVKHKKRKLIMDKILILILTKIKSNVILLLKNKGISVEISKNSICNLLSSANALNFCVSRNRSSSSGACFFKAII